MEDDLARLQRFYDAFNARALPRILEFMDEQIEFQSRFAAAGGAIYHGHDGVRGWLDDLAEAWETLEIEFEQAGHLEDGAMIALIVLHGRGRSSGLEIHEPVAHELQWRDGRVVRLSYRDRREAERLLGATRS